MNYEFQELDEEELKKLEEFDDWIRQNNKRLQLDDYLILINIHNIKLILNFEQFCVYTNYIIHYIKAKYFTLDKIY